MSAQPLIDRLWDAPKPYKGGNPKRRYRQWKRAYDTRKLISELAHTKPSPEGLRRAIPLMSNRQINRYLNAVKLNGWPCP